MNGGTLLFRRSRYPSLSQKGTVWERSRKNVAVLTVGLYVVLTGSIVLLRPETSFTTINLPGACSTNVFGINDTGHMVGMYSDCSGHSHGFVQTGTSVTNIDVPGASRIEARGINNAGQIVGLYQDSTGSHG